MTLSDPKKSSGIPHGTRCAGLAIRCSMVRMGKSGDVLWFCGGAHHSKNGASWDIRKTRIEMCDFLFFACFVCLCVVFQLIFKERGRQIIPALLMVKRLMDVINMCRYLNNQTRYMHITSRGKMFDPGMLICSSRHQVGPSTVWLMDQIQWTNWLVLGWLTSTSTEVEDFVL